jgi:hypothetical protein
MVALKFVILLLHIGFAIPFLKIAKKLKKTPDWCPIQLENEMLIMSNIYIYI